MEMNTADLEGVKKVSLSGSLDFKGTSELDQKLSAIAQTEQAVVIDLSGLEYLSSIGIRSLLATAKGIASRGGRMVLLGPNDLVRTVLITTGVDNVVPIVFDVDEAVRLARLPVGSDD